MASYDFSAPRLYVDAALSTGTVIALDRSQQNYLCNVLRLNEGENVLVFNGRDGEWCAALAPGPTRKQQTLHVAHSLRAQPPAGDLHYLFAPLKHARLDYMVQKAVEMGASSLCPVITRRTQATRVNSDRMRANVVEAAEQCGILSLAEVRDAEPLDEILRSWDVDRTLIFCDEDADVGAAIETLQTGGPFRKLALLIGPEGGFDPQERAQLLNFPSTLRLSLGPRILRADTAAVAAFALIQATLGDWRQV